jgi:hypothetical protein
MSNPQINRVGLQLSAKGFSHSIGVLMQLGRNEP